MITGNYPLESMKYFRPTGAVLDIKCPRCGTQLGGGMADGMIEYPEENTTVELECDCEEFVTVALRIALKYEIEVVEVR